MIALKKIRIWSFHLLALLSIAFFIGINIIVFVIQPICVDGYSMEPTLKNQEIVFINKIPHTLNREFDYGDIVAFDSRTKSSHTIINDIIDCIIYNQILSVVSNNKESVYRIKRVIGKSGDTLEFKGEMVIRNGKVLKEPYIKICMDYTNVEIVIPRNYIFVMGDNRNNSIDSRDFGCVPLDHVIGKSAFKF